MRDHAQLRPRFWTQGTGKRLRGDHEAREMALYLMSAPSSNMLGLYYLPVWTIQHELGYQTLEGAWVVLRRVLDSGFALYDEETEHVFVLNAAREQVGETLSDKDNRYKGIRTQLRQYRKYRFYRDFLEVYAEPYGLADLLKELPETKAPSSPSRPPSKQGSGEGEGSGETTTGVRDLPKAQPANDQTDGGDEADELDGSDLESTEPEATDADVLATKDLVRKRFRLRRVKETGNPPGTSHRNDPDYRAIGEWVDEKNGDPERIIRTLLDGFFADKWVRENGYPLAALAKDPAKYYAPPKVLRGSRRSGFMPPAQPEDFEEETDLDTIFGRKAAGAEGAE